MHIFGPLLGGPLGLRAATAHAVGRSLSTLPLWFRANSGLFWPLLGGPLRLRAATAHVVGRGLRFDAPAAVSREFQCISTLPLWFRTNRLKKRGYWGAVSGLQIQHPAQDLRPALRTSTCRKIRACRCFCTSAQGGRPWLRAAQGRWPFRV